MEWKQSKPGQGSQGLQDLRSLPWTAPRRDERPVTCSRRSPVYVKTRCLPHVERVNGNRRRRGDDQLEILWNKAVWIVHGLQIGKDGQYRTRPGVKHFGLQLVQPGCVLPVDVADAVTGHILAHRGHAQRVLDDLALGLELSCGFFRWNEFRRQAQLLDGKDPGVHDQAILPLDAGIPLPKAKDVARSDVCRAECIHAALMTLDAIGPLNAFVPAQGQHIGQAHYGRL